MRRYLTAIVNGVIRISIHASRAGCDLQMLAGGKIRQNFNPRIPCGMRPRQRHTDRAGTGISIHASRAGCDVNHMDLWTYMHISIHASHAGCDLWPTGALPMDGISIHASRAGCDRAPSPIPAPVDHFNPRIPCGMRRQLECNPTFPSYFNPRIPCGMRRGKASGTPAYRNHFNPRIPCGMRHDSMRFMTQKTL